MIAVAESTSLSFLTCFRKARVVQFLLALACLCSCCFGQLSTDLTLPSDTINSGNPVFEATNSITSSSSFLVQGSASVTLAAGNQITLGPGFHAAAGSAPFTFFAVVDATITQPPDGPGLPSIPGSYTASAYSPTCSNISGQWIDYDNFGNSIGWDLNQSGNSVTGTMSFEDYRDLGAGLTDCGTISYSASGVSNGNGGYSLSAVNPVPAIDSCGLPLASSETENVTLSGQACGSGTGTFTISGGGGTQSLSRAAPSSVGAGTMNATALPAATSGTSTWTTYSPRFTISYASYIPVDNIHGPWPCFLSVGVGLPIPILRLYEGDANRGTYRTQQAIFVVPDKQYDDNFFANTGPTRNYGYGSPANGSTLSSYPTSPDIYNGPYAGADEDNVQYDCYFWNDKGQATTATMQNRNVTFPDSHHAVITLSGLGQNPLEFQLGGIQWNATITLDTTDPNNPTAQATISHTCYPAHIITVNGKNLLDDQPTYNNAAYLLGCLLQLPGFPQKTTTTSAIVVPNK
jgi:hypothetical protein